MSQIKGLAVPVGLCGQNCFANGGISYDWGGGLGEGAVLGAEGIIGIFQADDNGDLVIHVMEILTLWKSRTNWPSFSLTWKRKIGEEFTGFYCLSLHYSFNAQCHFFFFFGLVFRKSSSLRNLELGKRLEQEISH